MIIPSCVRSDFYGPFFMMALPPTNTAIFGIATSSLLDGCVTGNRGTIVVSEDSGFSVVRSDDSQAVVGRSGKYALANVAGIACDDNGEHLFVAELGCATMIRSHPHRLSSATHATSLSTQENKSIGAVLRTHSQGQDLRRHYCGGDCAWGGAELAWSLR